jgi:hypothetical protein
VFEGTRQVVPCLLRFHKHACQMWQPLIVVHSAKPQRVRHSATQGEIRLNGHPKEEGVWRRVSAYVEQTDIHTETVRWGGEAAAVDSWQLARGAPAGSCATAGQQQQPHL